MEDMQPGQVIVPHDSPAPAQPAANASVPVQAPEAAAPPTPQPSTPPVAPAPQVLHETAVQSEQPVADPNAPADSAGGWQFHAEQSPSSGVPSQPLPDGIEWTAAEFTAHDKSAGWYGLIILAGIVCAAVDYFLTKDIFSTVCIIIAAILFAVVSAHKPRAQHYSLSTQGIQVGQRFYSLQDFKTFSVTEEAGASTLVFMPLRRFMPVLTVPLDASVADNAVDFLSALLPFEQHKTDVVDGLLRRIRF